MHYPRPRTRLNARALTRDRAGCVAAPSVRSLSLALPSQRTLAHRALRPRAPTPARVREHRSDRAQAVYRSDLLAFPALASSELPVTASARRINREAVSTRVRSSLRSARALPAGLSALPCERGADCCQHEPAEARSRPAWRDHRPCVPSATSTGLISRSGPSVAPRAACSHQGACKSLV